MTQAFKPTLTMRKGENLLQVLDNTNKFPYTSLFINDKKIGPEGAAFVAGTLSYNSSLTLLDLSGNDIGDEGVFALSLCLGKINTTLELLTLQNNNITSVGVGHLVSSQLNFSLISLNLSFNDIGDEGLISLQNLFLRENKLKEVILIKCGITTTGVIVLSYALAVKCSFKLIDLSHNLIESQGAEALLSFKDISTIKLKGNPLTEAEIDQFTKKKSYWPFFSENQPVEENVEPPGSDYVPLDLSSDEEPNVTDVQHLM